MANTKLRIVLDVDRPHVLTPRTSESEIRGPWLASEDDVALPEEIILCYMLTHRLLTLGGLPL